MVVSVYFLLIVFYLFLSDLATGAGLFAWRLAWILVLRSSAVVVWSWTHGGDRVGGIDINLIILCLKQV